MNTQITARHFQASPLLHAKVQSQVEKLSRFNDSITHAHVVLDIQKNGTRRAELILSVHKKSLSAIAEEENMHKAIESMMGKAERQLKKENEKQKEHRATPAAEAVNAFSQV